LPCPELVTSTFRETFELDCVPIVEPHAHAPAYRTHSANPQCGAHPAGAQDDARKVVDQYVKAAGGAKALSRIQTLTLEGTFTSEDGKTGTYTLDTKLPNRYYSELLAGEKNLIEAYNGKSAWHRNAAGELGTLVVPKGCNWRRLRSITTPGC